jgi:hypothetical protein
LSAACVLFSSLLPGGQPLWELFRADHYRMTTLHRTGYRAIAQIPRDASVVAQAAVVPHISQRDHVFMLDAKAPDADFVIAARGLNPWPLGSDADIARLIDDRRRLGYRLVFDESGWTVLRREATTGPADLSPSP